MSEILNTNEYFASVVNATRYVYDKNSGKRYSLRSLFFLQRFAEGQHAFTRYEDLLEKSENEYDQATSYGHDTMRQILRQYSARKQSPTRPVLPHVKKGYQSESELLLSSITSALNPKQFKNQERNSVNLLLDEPRDLCNKLIFSATSASRVLILANAGFGKTTLIQRIALALSDCGPDVPEIDREIDRSFLSSIEEKELNDIVPCVISLRDRSAGLNSIDSLIINAVISTMQAELSNEAVNEWLKKVRTRLVLLIDGLDELPSELVVPFLSELEHYLFLYPSTRVIMTTRVSGIDDDEARAILQKTNFRGRTILPLSDQEAKQFCEQWIQETKSSPDLLKSLDRIQTESHLKYLREFIRKPLELVMLLQYLPHQSYASFNRWDLFYNILWAEITNHVKFENKQSVYDDECKFLSFLAFQMQIRNMQSLTFTELETLLPSIMRLSFYTDIFGSNSDNCGITADKVWKHLKHVAQNIGTVETIESTKSVTIPLRSYQEYLVAYACCNLCLIDGELYPNPSKLLEPYINESTWLGVLGFVIAGMECNEFADLDQFLSSLYSTAESINSLCDLMEVDFFNSRESAKSLCRVKLRKITLGSAEKQLIERCMQSKSSFSFRWALTVLYRDAFSEGSDLFLEAVSYAYLIEAIEKGNNPISLASELLQSTKGYEKNIGAELLVLVSGIKLGEEPVDERVLDAFEMKLSDDLLIVLRDLAVVTKAPVFVRALTELTISQLADPCTVTAFLDHQLLDLACEQLFLNEAEVKKQILSTGTLQGDYIQYLKNLINTIGLFPYQLGSVNFVGNHSPWIRALVSAYYDFSFDDLDLDQISIAICKYHIAGATDDFIVSWAEDICKGRLSSEVRKDHLTKRENRHFLLVRDSISKEESDYYLKQNSKLNRVSITDLQPVSNNPTELFIAGEDTKALELSLRLYREGYTANNNNLAFLVRFLKYDTTELFGLSRWAFLDALLYDGVKAHEPYSTMNYALSLLERDDTDQAKQLLHAMSTEELSDISRNFWYPIMWKKRMEPEGALVCLLSQRAGAATFPESEEMLKTVTDRAPLWADVL
ncbi:NACHT domain-containing protein [bacterium 210820-DFI.6.37]|nr:NACHT domain-containing protein [bacterium 210820-DFI.6.37]